MALDRKGGLDEGDWRVQYLYARNQHSTDMKRYLLVHKVVIKYTKKMKSYYDLEPVATL